MKNKTKNSKLVIAIIVTIMMLNPVLSAETDILNPEMDEKIDLDQEDLIIEWEATQDHSNTDSLETTEIEFEDDEGNTIEITVDQTDSDTEGISEGESVILTYGLDYDSREEELTDGLWDVEAVDLWGAEDLGEPVQSQDSLTIDVENAEEEEEETVEEDPEDEEDSASTEVLEPDNYDGETSLNLDIEVTNHFEDNEQVLEESTIEFEDDGGRLVDFNYSPGITLGPQESQVINRDIMAENIDELDDGQWEVRVDHEWGFSESSDTHLMTVDSQGDDENVSGSGEIDIKNPQGTNNIYEDLEVEWKSINSFEESIELLGSQAELQDPMGRTADQDKNIQEIINRGESENYLVNFDSDDFSTFDEGEWTLTVEDTWAEDSVEESLIFVMEESDDDDEESDEEDIDDESGDDEQVEDGGDESGDDETGGDDGSDEETDGGGVDCPEGFVWDGGVEVCVEDVDDGGSGEGDDVSGSVSGGVEQEEGGLGSLVVGPVVGGVPVWMVLAGLLVVGVLFRRSDYELDL